MRGLAAGVMGVALLALPALAQAPRGGDESNPTAGVTSPPIVSRPAAAPPAAPAAARQAPAVPAEPKTAAPADSRPAAASSDVARRGMSKAWGELLESEKAKQAATAAGKPEPEPSGRVLGVGTGRGQGGKPPQLSESDKICQRSLQQLLAEAEKGNAQSAFRVGVIYEEGCGVRGNRQTAAAYYELAAKHGHADGAVRLGGYYVQGEVLGTDYKKARALLEGPAAKGHPLAHYHLAVMAYRGDETKPAKPDIPLAMKHFRAAAEGGFAQAQFILGQTLVEGKELPQDLKTAKTMLQRASNQGFAWAMVILGRLHAEKLLADADPSEAFKWLMLAKQIEKEDTLLHQVADQSLPLLEGKLDPDQRGRLMKQVFDFKPKIEWEEKI